MNKSPRPAPSAAQSSCQGTNRFPTVMQCWPRSPKASARSRTIPPARIASRPSACMRALGAEVERNDGVVQIEGRGLEGLREPAAMLDAGNSGSTIRMLSGILAAQPFVTCIGGDESLSRRPMERIMKPLAQMGARIEARENRFPPLTIHGSQASSHGVHAAGGQRAGKELRAVGRAVRRRPHHRA